MYLAFKNDLEKKTHLCEGLRSRSQRKFITAALNATLLLSSFFLLERLLWSELFILHVSGVRWGGARDTGDAGMPVEFPLAFQDPS